MRRVTGALAFILILGFASNALALDIPLMDLRVGLRGGPNVNILPEVDEDDTTPVYPGFVGVGWVIGGAIMFDYLDIIGIEIGLLYASESASGGAEFDGDLGDDNQKEESDLLLESSGLHFPLLVKVSIPLGVVRPFLHLGADFNFSRSDHALTVTQLGDAPSFTESCTPGVNCDPFPAQNYGVDPVDSITYAVLGIGLDIDVSLVTIPIEFRALINPSISNSIFDRTSINPTDPTFRYTNEWQYQIQILFGANYVIF